jgi:hypothetical protein
MLLLDIWLSSDENRVTQHLTSLYQLAAKYTDVDTIDAVGLEKIYGVDISWRRRMQKLCKDQTPTRFDRSRYNKVESLLRFTERGKVRISREQVWHEYLRGFRPDWMCLLANYVEPGPEPNPNDALVIGGSEMAPQVNLIVRLPLLYLWFKDTMEGAKDKLRERVKRGVNEPDTGDAVKALVTGAGRHEASPCNVWATIRKGVK